MSEGKIWAKIVNDEIMQTHDDSPHGLWHPDTIEKNDIPGHWEEVPDYCNVGWKLKNNEWISGSQWMEEREIENPPGPPGPPWGTIGTNISEDRITKKVKVFITCNVIGIVDSATLEFNNKTYEDFSNHIEVEFDQIDTPQTLVATLTIIGPGGTVVKTTSKEDDNEIVIPEIFIPMILRSLRP